MVVYKYMNVLFLTIGAGMDKIHTSSIYNDLMRKFANEGHQVYVVYPNERRSHLGDTLKEEEAFHLLGVKTLNVQKTNAVERGLGQVTLEYLYQRAIKKYFKRIKFDLILYSTPPITLTKVITSVKKANPYAKSYLMLKDIFPQNAVDLGMLTKKGLKGLLYKSFRKKEQKMYALSDFIGCMSPANEKFVLEHNPEVPKEKVEICPNSFEVVDFVSQPKKVCCAVRRKYNLPTDKPIFFYGGNLGKPQGIPFLIECLEANRDRFDCHFLVLGDGFDYPLIEKWYKENHPKNMSLMRRLPKEDYDNLANACDVGLIFLDYRFTIPNFPSRLLNCLMQKKPIIACTDPNSDLGTIAAENGFGMCVPSNNVESFTAAVDDILNADVNAMGERAYQFFLDNYTTQHTYDAIMKHF